MSMTNEREEQPGDRAQTWYCPDCEEWHVASVIGGPLALSAESPPLKSLREVDSERTESEAA